MTTLNLSPLFFSRGQICFYALNAGTRTLTRATADGPLNPVFEGATVRLTAEATDELKSTYYGDTDLFVDLARSAHAKYVESGKRVWHSKKFEASPDTNDLLDAITDADLFAEHFPAGLSEEDFFAALDAAREELVELDVETGNAALYHDENLGSYYNTYLRRTA